MTSDTNTTMISQDIVPSVNRFGFLVQSRILQPDKSSGLCSMNIYHCLALVAAGSKDKTLNAFGEALGFDSSDVNGMVNRIVELDCYSKTNSAVELRSASSVWHKNSFVLTKMWEEIAHKKFAAAIGPIALGPINEFIEKETKGKFKDLIKSGPDLESAILLLVTCLYFKAKWVKSFDKDRSTEMEVFNHFDGTVEFCIMMHMLDRMEYKEDKKMQLCVLPYKTNDPSSKSCPNWKAAIILPKEKGFLAIQGLLTTFSSSPDILRTLLKIQNPSDGPALSRLVARLGSRTSSNHNPKVRLDLPRFSMKLNLELIPSLEKLGLAPAFQFSHDFSPMSDTGLLAISRATHDLFIEVNEEGTEMAAVTTIVMT